MVQVWGKGPEEAVAKRPRTPAGEESVLKMAGNTFRGSRSEMMPVG
jgi:hypothetical protein